MRILAKKGGNDVVIVGFLYKGANHDALKGIFVKSDGTIEDTDVANLTVVTGDLPVTSFVDAIKKLKPKTW